MIRGRPLARILLEMCETCAQPHSSRPRVPWVAKSQLAAVAIGLAVMALAGAFGSNRQAPSTPAADGSAPDRVFAEDIARQTAESRDLLARAATSPALATLLRRIEREDSNALAATRLARAPVPLTRAAPLESSMRQAVRRHIAADRIIAQVEVATGTRGSAKRAATRLLEISRTWSIPRPPP